MARHVQTPTRMAVLDATPLDLSRAFLPEALAGVSVVRALDEQDRRRLEPVRACSYLHLFDLLEAALGDAARERARHDIDTRDALAPHSTAQCCFRKRTKCGSRRSSPRTHAR